MERSSNDEIRNFPLDDFIQENSPLFVVMGVFGAISIYLLNMDEKIANPGADSFISLGGFVAALSLSILMIVLIFQNMVREAGSIDEWMQLHKTWKNADLIAFNTLIYLLLASIGEFLLQYTPAKAIFLTLISLVAAMAIVSKIIFGSMGYWGSENEEAVPEGILTGFMLFCISGIIGIIIGVKFPFTTTFNLTTKGIRNMSIFMIFGISFFSSLLSLAAVSGLGIGLVGKWLEQFIQSVQKRAD